MLAATDKFMGYLRTSHTREIRVHLYGVNPGGGAPIDYGELQIARGSIELNITQFVGRTLNASIALDPFGTLSRRSEQSLAIENGYLTVEIGMHYPDKPTQPEWIKIATLRLTRFSPNASLATTTIEAMDRSIMLRDYAVNNGEMAAQGYQAKLDAGYDWIQAVKDLVAYAMIGETVTVDAGVTAANLDPKTQFLNTDRDGLINQFAESHNAWLRCDPDGKLHLSPRPTQTTTPVWEVQHGEGGVLVESDEEYARELIYNGVWIEWQAPEKPPPDNYVYSLRYDNNPTSATYWNGPFGRRVKTVTDLPVTWATVDGKAQQLLNDALGRYFNIEITCLVNPLLELGDTIAVQAMDMPRHLRVIERINLPLGPEATMQITTRTATT